MFWTVVAASDAAGARTVGDGARTISIGAEGRGSAGGGTDKANGAGLGIECDSVLDDAAAAADGAAKETVEAALLAATAAAAEEEEVAAAAAFSGSRRSRAKNSATPISASSNVGGRVTLRRTHLGRCAAAAGAANRSSSRMTAP